MTYQNWRFIHPTLVALALLWMSLLFTACGPESQRSAQPIQPTVNSNDPLQTDQSGSESLPAPASYPPFLGTPGLKEKVFDADVVVRARLASTGVAAQHIGTNEDGSAVYGGLLEFRFEVLEYLKGAGGDELIVWGNGFPNSYQTMEHALEAAKSWELERNTLWDDREAIVLAKEVEVPNPSDESKRYSFGHNGAYSVDSGYKAWLPSAIEADVKDEASNVVSDELGFLVVRPPAPVGFSSRDTSVVPTAQLATISVPEMRALIAELEQWRRQGEGVEGHLKCIRDSFARERRINGKKERGESLNTTYDFYLNSGLQMDTVINEPLPMDGKWWLQGKDGNLFAFANGALRTTRPLPTGEYRFFSSYQMPVSIPCNYHPDEYKTRHENFVHVTAPEGTLHEAFFDPVAVGASVTADVSNGVLEPASFKVEDMEATTIGGITWESQRVRMEFSPSAPPAGNHSAFIALDGSVVLRLKIEDATQVVEGNGTTLTWGVCSQPWEAGDKLLLRISESGPDLTGTTNDSECLSSNP